MWIQDIALINSGFLLLLVNIYVINEYHGYV
jgi:hypothetical protein